MRIQSCQKQNIDMIPFEHMFSYIQKFVLVGGYLRALQVGGCGKDHMSREMSGIKTACNQVTVCCRIVMPPRCPLGKEALDTYSAYLLDNGRIFVLWLGAGIAQNQDFMSQVHTTSSVMCNLASIQCSFKMLEDVFSWFQLS